MAKVENNKTDSKSRRLKWAKIKRSAMSWWRKSPAWKRIAAGAMAVLLLWVFCMYSIAQWYIIRHRNEPLQYGATFIAPYAEYYGLDPKEVLSASINDLGIRRYRLVSYWDHHEAKRGVYDFSELDWQFDMIEKAGGTVSLAIGLRQPRWPECHIPTWAEGMTIDKWQPELFNYIKVVIDRYKNRTSLVDYQLENEFFMKVFGICPDFSRQRLIDEFNYVKKLDPSRPVIISRSNNALGLPIGQPRPDQFGISVYKRVWDKNITKRYFEYPFPAWFYGFLAGAGELITGRSMMIHELQAEAWLPESYDMRTAPLSEQNKSLNAKRLRDRIEYGRATGMRTIDLWGVEWWYHHKVNLQDDSLWLTVKQEVPKTVKSR